MLEKAVDETCDIVEFNVQHEHFDLHKLLHEIYHLFDDARRKNEFRYLSSRNHKKPEITKSEIIEQLFFERRNNFQGVEIYMRDVKK